MSKPLSTALVLTCEHAGNEVPAAYRALFRGHKKLLASHRGWDPGALPLAQAVSKAMRTPLFATNVTRLLVESNRSLHHPALFSAITRDLDAETREQIIQTHYLPHRRRVHEAVGALINRGTRVLHVGVHTFTPVLNGEVREVDIGVLYDPARRLEKAMGVRWVDILRRECDGLRIRRNHPYRGASDGLTTALRREFPEKLYLGFELEINQAIAAGNNAAARDVVVRAITTSLRELLAD